MLADKAITLETSSDSFHKAGLEIKGVARRADKRMDGVPAMTSFSQSGVDGAQPVAH